MALHPQAGKLPTPDMLENIPALISDYFLLTPNPYNNAHKISFGTSGHRGSATKISFNEAHILAATQAVCDYRKAHGIEGTLFMGMDTHALSYPAQLTAIRVLAANGVETKIAKDRGYTPTPVISHAILTHNQAGRALCDGIVITPSHNPPSDGGFKYNGPNGGPADTDVTDWIQNHANILLENNLKDVKSFHIDDALKESCIQEYDFVTPYVSDLKNVIDMEAIQNAKLKIAADALGGAGMAYYRAIKEMYDLDMTLYHDSVDERFAFMHCDHDGKIRMDCSSPHAMAGLVALKDDFDIAFGNDTDFDRHGIVTPTGGLMNPNHYLSVAIWYLSTHREGWSKELGIGKTLVSSSMIDRVVHSLGKSVKEVPVGFKWYVQDMFEGKIAFGGEESAGASFLRKDGSAWSTDKDGIIMSLLAAEICAVTGKNPSEHYEAFTKEFGEPIYARIDVPSTPEQKAILKKLSPSDLKADTLAGEQIEEVLTKASGNGASIGGLKVVSKNGWFAVRPSGTEDIYKIYAESFLGAEHLNQIQEEAKAMLQELF
jgi:phosphoglucomutase